MVRNGQLSDMLVYLGLARKAWESQGEPAPFNKERAQALWRTSCASGALVALVYENEGEVKGFVIGMLDALPVALGRIVTTVLMWCDDDEGIWELGDALQDWASTKRSVFKVYFAVSADDNERWLMMKPLKYDFAGAAYSVEVKHGPVQLHQEGH